MFPKWFGLYMQKSDAKILPNITCTCCHSSFKKSVSFKFNTDKYDFSSYIISCALALKHHFVADSAEYIHWSCHKCLHSNEHKQPSMPHFAVVRQTCKPGYKFLKSLQEILEFVCTCCH